MGKTSKYRPKELFRTLATAEAVTWTLLLSGLVGKQFWEWPQNLVTVIGGIHGAVFLGHAKDDHWFDRLYRWFINRPILLAAVLALVVVVIFATLLIVGPPGGWPKQS